MKKGIILSVFTLFLVLAMGCERDAVLPKLNISVSDHLRTLDISGDMDISISSQVSETRGFPITPNRGNDGKKTATIDFLNGDWDNGSHKPTVLVLILSPRNGILRVDWAKALQNDEYTYSPASSSSPNPKLKIRTSIEYYDENVDKSYFWIIVLDHNLKYTCEDSHGRYDVNFNFPTLRREFVSGRATDTYLLKPLSESNLRLIFESPKSLKEVINNKGSLKNYTLFPFGSLILFDIQNVSDEEYTIENNYQLLIKTSGFSFENANFSVSDYRATHTPLFDGAGFDKTVYGYKFVDGKAVVDKSNILRGVSMDYTKIKLEMPSGESSVNLSAKSSGAASRSAVYGLYVMKNSFSFGKNLEAIDNYGGLSIYHQYSGSSNPMGDLIFDAKTGLNYYKFYRKTYSMTLSVPSGNGLLEFGEGPDLDKYTDPWGILHDFNDGSNIKDQTDNDPNAKLHDFDDSNDLNNITHGNNDSNSHGVMNGFGTGEKISDEKDSNKIPEDGFDHSNELPNQADPKK